MELNASDLLWNRFVVIIGDSIQRCIYKDLVLMLQDDSRRCLTKHELKSKGEKSFLGDELLEGGCMDSLNNGTSYREVRQFQTNTHVVRFYFITRCYSPYFESILDDLKEFPKPDIVIMNSCLWDMTRYGKSSITDYKENLGILFSRLEKHLPSNCLVIWNTTLPISSCARGGFLVPEIDFNFTTLRLDILEANYFASKLAVDHEFDVLDLHFYFRSKLYMRADDGIHWDKTAHRIITNLLLNHIAGAWDLTEPARTHQTSTWHFQPDWSDSSCSRGLIQSMVVMSSGDETFHNLPVQDLSLPFVWQPYQENLVMKSPAASSPRSRYRPYRRHNVRR